MEIQVWHQRSFVKHNFKYFYCYFIP